MMRQKIYSREELKGVIDELRAHSPSPKIVFTNGCFDLLHVGHLRYLCEARRLGDVLVVAVNDDDSIRRLKGAQRPILTLSERLQVLSGLTCVDYVTWFSEDTPIPLLRALRPDALVKGANYPVEGVVGREVAQEWGAEVHVVRLTEGRSTTTLIDRVLATKRHQP